jgi:O-Antigen ligase
MRISLPEKYHNWLYLAGLAGIAFGLAVNKVVISIGVIWVGVNWLWEGGFADKFRLLKARNSVLILIGIFLLHVIGLLWTSDLKNGFHDVRIKIPLLVLPLVIGTSRPLEKRKFEFILLMFIAGVIISTFRTWLISSALINKQITDFRQASDLVALIRLSLFAALSIFLLLRWIYRNDTMWIRIVSGFFVLWLVYFLIHMQSLTGLLALATAGPVIAVIVAITNKKRKLIAGVLLFITPFFGFAGYSIYKAYRDFYSLRGNEMPKLYVRSPTGFLYEHHLDIPVYENGNKVMVNLCWGDIVTEWKRRSKIPIYGGVDRNGGSIQYTIARYMSSRNLLKDSAGIWQLSDAEIRAIENGVTNCRDAERNTLERRAYQVFWEIYNYANGGDPSGSSVSMRLEVLGAAMYSIGNHPWIGTGTGSQTFAYNEYYRESGSRLHEGWQWLHVHNQILEIAVTLGIPAALFFIFSLWWPAYSMRKMRSVLYLSFFLITLLSFLDDDTLETQQGVTFYAFFNALLLYAMPFASAAFQSGNRNAPEQEAEQ